VIEYPIPVSGEMIGKIGHGTRFVVIHLDMDQTYKSTARGRRTRMPDNQSF
jgi:hypothetical protein